MGRSNLGIAQSGLAWSELGIKQDGGDNDEDGFEQEKKGRKRNKALTVAWRGRVQRSD